METINAFMSAAVPYCLMGLMIVLPCIAVVLILILIELGKSDKGSS